MPCFAAEQFATERQFVAAAAIGQESELTEALKAAWQHVQQEAADELVSSESHRALLIAVAIIFPTKGDLTVFEIEQAVIGDGHAVSVAASTRRAAYPAGQVQISSQVFTK